MGCGKSSAAVASSPAPMKVSSTGTAASDRLTIRPSTFIKSRVADVAADYEFCELLGSGAFAQVKRAVHKASGNIRAIKILHKMGLQSQMVDEKSQLREFNFLSQLDHPNILRVFGLYEDKLHFYVVMEYCQGGELFTLLSQRKSFSEADAAKLMFQMMSATAYCHEKKVIHRDLKPENVLLEGAKDDLQIKIADFGSSAFLDVHGRLNGVFGSPYYLAPEVLSQCYNEKCDMWSIGIIMYILLTGKPPYVGRSEQEIMQRVMRGELNLSKLNTLSADAQDLVNKLLLRSVKERLSASQALAHPWIQKFRNATVTDSAILSSALSQMRAFHHTSKLKEAIYTYIATQLISEADTKDLREAFQGLDKNGDGRLSKEELLLLYRTTLGDAEADVEANKLIANVDTDHSGFIDYSEFLKASLDRSKHLCKQNLEVTFKAFDVDGSGQISAVELKAVLAGGEGCEDGVWNALIQEADQNGDGQLDIKEFKELIMRRM